jgi:uncharacterized linocin/CFP29 family protein
MRDAQGEEFKHFCMDLEFLLSIGYESHDADAVQLYLEESFAFQVATAEAAVPLAL